MTTIVWRAWGAAMAATLFVVVVVVKVIEHFLPEERRAHA